METCKDNEALASKLGRRGGFTAFPTLVLKFQKQLGLTNAEVGLLLHVLRFQKDGRKTVDISVKKLARESGASPSTIYRMKRDLRRKQLVSITSPVPTKGQRCDRSCWDMEPCLRLAETFKAGGVDWRVKVPETGPKTDDLESEDFGDSDRLLSVNLTDSQSVTATDLLRSLTASRSHKEQDLKICGASAPPLESSCFGGSKSVQAEEETSKAKEKGSAQKEKVPPLLSLDPVQPQLPLIKKEVSVTPEDKAALQASTDAVKAKTKEVVEKAAAKKAAKAEQLPPEAIKASKPAKAAIFGYGEAGALHDSWKAASKAAFPTMTIADKWGKAEYSMLAKLREKYPLALIDATIRYLFGSWDQINTKMFKGTAHAPTLGMLVKLHESLTAGAQVWQKTADVFKERDEWDAAHPDDLRPQDLQDRINQATVLFGKAK